MSYVLKILDIYTDVIVSDPEKEDNFESSQAILDRESQSLTSQSMVNLSSQDKSSTFGIADDALDLGVSRR